MTPNTSPIGFLCLLMLPYTLLNAQSDAQILQIGTLGSESVEHIATSADGHLIIGGLFDDTLSLGETTFGTQGLRDVFVAKTNENELAWVRTFGSSAQDELLALTTAPDTSTIIGLSYLNEIAIDGIIYTPFVGSRGILLLKLTPNGAIDWLKNVSSTAEQTITDLQVTAQNQLFLTGYFGGTLYVDDTQLTAQASQDALLVQLAPDGTLVQTYHTGLSGSIRPQSLVLNHTENLIHLSGIFRGSLRVAGQSIQTNTDDFDVFVMQLDTSFQEKWLRKAGGVYEDNNTAILTDTLSNVYVVGDFQGVLKLDESLQVTTNGIFDNNIYLLKYNTLGTPLWARSLGGATFEYVTDAVWAAPNQLAVVGYFQDTIRVDGLTAVAATNFDTFVLGFEAQVGQAQWLESVHSHDLAIGNSLALRQNTLVLGGAFTETLQYQNELLDTKGAYDGFLVYFPASLTPVRANLPKQAVFSVFPNPTTDMVYIKSPLEKPYTTILYHQSGQKMGVFKQTEQISLQTYPAGLYFLAFYINERLVQTTNIIRQ